MHISGTNVRESNSQSLTITRNGVVLEVLSKDSKGIKLQITTGKLIRDGKALRILPLDEKCDHNQLVYVSQ